MAMSWPLNEPIIKALQTQLVAQIPGAVSSINAANTDGFLIAAPDSGQILDYMPIPASLEGGLPCIGIGDMNSSVRDDIGVDATGTHDLAVVTFAHSSDQRELAWMLRRYAQASLRAITYDRRLGGACWGMRIKGVTPGPTLGSTERPREWLSYVGIRIEVDRSEG